MNIDYQNFVKKNNLPSLGSKVVVAMSGGVDSSVTAAILQKAGYEVIGVTMQLYEAKSKKNPKTCCSGVDIADAREVSKKLGIKHYVINYKSRFREAVIDDFVDSYLNGETPIPCIRCNQTVKFTDLIDFTKSLNCSVLATGHYVKRVEKKNVINLYQAEDKFKDQSYFLFSTTQEQLKILRFPLGHYSKTQIREFAVFFDLKVAQKADSQDICFIPDGNYRKFIKKQNPDSFKEGLIETFNGEIVGTHNGILDYTIGQRRGIGVGGVKGKTNQKPMYVLNIDRGENKIVVGPKEKLSKYYFYIKDLNFFANKFPIRSFKAYIKIRSGQKLTSAKVKISKKDNNLGTVELFEPEFGVAPGQACVFYDNYKKLIGGGWIYSGEKII